ncbi:MAG TPA: periplasmic heavy metal sensor [Bryobacteraceae bacterium]|jgi:Spy/CpxP family protein refolding chaperone|nr:periplasmic heavy metal sensor [Bryobacteraceae bacterium]
MKLRILLLVAACAFSLRAQNIENFPWWNQPVRDQIGLTSEQSEKIRQIVRAHRNKLLDARNNTLKAEGDLQDVMNGPQVDPAQAKAVIDRLAAARAESSRVFLEMSVELRSVLTLDQWRQLVRRWDQEHRAKAKQGEALP